MAKFIEGMKWSQEEKDLLKELYPSNSKEKLLLSFPDRTWKAINCAANRYKIRKDDHYEKWTQDEEDLLIELYETISMDDMLIALPKRELGAIWHKANKMGLRKYEKHKEERTIWNENNTRQIVESAGYQFVDTYIEKNHRFIVVLCELGHETRITSYNFDNGQRCTVCSGKYKREYSEVCDYYEQEQYIVNTEEQDYKNGSTPIDVTCPNGHHTTSTYSGFKSGARCKRCYFEIIGKSRVIEYSVVLDIFKNKNCELISKVYTGANELLDFICLNHIDDGVQKKSYSNFKHSIGCNYCAEEVKASSARIDFNEVIKSFEQKNMILVSTSEDYISSKHQLQYICLSHPEKGIQEKTYADSKNQSAGCNFCSWERNSGENHPSWNGGISGIAEHLRGKIQPWKNDSLKNSNYQCDITGISNHKVIHHIHPFSHIVQETLLSLSLSAQPTREYTKDQLRAIENTCLELHYKYGLGACLNTDIHNLFHTLYSVHNFTVDDYYEFKKRYINGEFEDPLE